MNVIKGKGVFDAIAIGKILFYKRNNLQIMKENITDTEFEKARFYTAKETAKQQLSVLYEKAAKEIGKPGAQIFEAYQLLLEDQEYNDSIIKMIEHRKVNAEYAVALVSDRFMAVFSSMDDEYMKERAADVKDVSDRIVNNLLAGKNGNTYGEAKAISGSGAKYIICADDLTPSETMSLDKNSVLAFVTKYGSGNSHTAILARSMNIPAVVGAGEALCEMLDGKLAAVDGFTGELYVEPDENTLGVLIEKQRTESDKKEALRSLRGQDAVTADGTRIHISVNVATMQEIDEALTDETSLLNDADGIGLFRSEFLYLEHKGCPDEQTQFEAYRKVLLSMNRKKTVIRTLDIGADKQIAGLTCDTATDSAAGEIGFEYEQNPALGCRGIRVSLVRPEIFKTQLRALFRASIYGTLAILFPMITSVNEIMEIKKLIEQVKTELDTEGIRYSDQVEIGAMIETPAAAVISDLLAPEVDFFSVGTNDLTQYTLAIDRQNPKLDRFCDNHHEAILRLIEYAAQSAHHHGKWIGICGELAADTQLTERWLRMGIDELSVLPAYVLTLRDCVRKIDLRSQEKNR